MSVFSCSTCALATLYWSPDVVVDAVGFRACLKFPMHISLLVTLKMKFGLRPLASDLWRLRSKLVARILRKPAYRLGVITSRGKNSYEKYPEIRRL